MPSKLINIGIVDPHTLFRKVLENYLSVPNYLNVILQAGDFGDLVSKLKYSPVHVLLMDIIMHEIDGVESVRLIKEEFPNVKILILTMCTDMEVLSDLLNAGVYGVLSKADKPEELLDAIVSISEEKIYRSRFLTEIMYWSKQSDISRSIKPSSLVLNEREKEILQLLWEEKSNKEIASHLYLSVRSIEKIRQEMKEKIGAKSIIGLIKYAINNKIIAINRHYNDVHSMNRE